jgi:predicted AAA+ superfamily ATPase
MISRHLQVLLRDALADRPVVLLQGARQVGKSTLARTLADEGRPPRRYLTMDDAAVLAAAQADPDGFIAGLDGPVVLDEIQRTPGLFLSIKAVVDRHRQPGRFLLTGSAEVLLLPKLSETLAGRMEILTLWPLSQGEIEGAREGFVDAVFGDRLPPLPGAPSTASGLPERIVRGGYPELVAGGTRVRQRAWFGSYITTILQRDVRDLAHIEGLTALPRLLALLAARPMGLLNYADLARHSGLPQSTLKRYLTLLETTFLVRTLPAWFVNVGKRLAKAPKVFLTDTGLAAHLMGTDALRLREDRGLLGPLLENFVAMEATKQAAWSRAQPQLFHFHTAEGHEVDLVLEEASGRIMGIEVKAAATVGEKDFKGLRVLAQAAGGRFRRGVLLYTGTQIVPFGANLHAVPLEALWRWRSSSRG